MAGAASSTTRKTWKNTFDLIAKMRATTPAPVDTIGCASLFDAKEPPQTIRFQILVSLLLSSQTKDEVTAAAVSRLKSLPGGLHYTAMIKVDEELLGETIKPVGFYRRKAKNLIEISRLVKDKYDGDIPRTAEELMGLPGIGPKMAYLAVQHAWNENSGIGVDVHVHRISNRLGWVRTKEPEETRLELESFLPKDHWKDINHLLVGFGQTICSAKNPKCASCLLNTTCPSSQVKPKPEAKRKRLFEGRLFVQSLHDFMIDQQYPPTYPPPAYQQPISTPGYKEYPGHVPQQQQQPYPAQMPYGYQYGYPPPLQQQQQPQQQQSSGMCQGLLAGMCGAMMCCCCLDALF